MAGNNLGVVAAVLAVPALAFGTVFGVLLLGTGAQATCNGPAVGVDPAAVPDTTVAGYGREQLVNAAHILAAGQALDLGVRDQTIGVMTAMGESSLRVIDYGDSAGPDSRGLFQQRDNGAWGSYADRMDPFISASNFFKAMMKVEGRDALEPTIVAHRTQRNADPFHYTKYWEPAVMVVEALAGTDTGLAPGATDPTCGGVGAGVPGQVSPGGWAVPAAGPITSGYGMRYHPVDKVMRLHNGTDLGGGGCDGPIWAAKDGVVTFTGFDRQGNGTITIDHGGGIQTSYLHMYASGILAREGDQVTAGQQIARVGNSGKSKGCHLHFTVRVNGESTNPEPFMAAAGAPLG